MGESCVSARRPSTRTSERPPHDPSSMCPRQTLLEENVIGDMAENSPAEESADPNGPLNSVEARLGQISATLDSLSTELAILRASRRRGSELLLEEVESPPLQLVLETKTRKSGGDPSSSVFKKSSVVRLNVGGKVFHVSWQLLQQIPDSRLGRLAQCESEREALAYCDQCNCAENEVFFNHRYQNMEDILDFYRSGTLHISTDCCPMAFVSDLVYWGFQETSLEPCCLKRWLECKEQVEWEQAREEVKVEEFPEGAPAIQRKLWDLFEHPHTSSLARVLGVISVACIFISTIILTLDTMPYFQEHENKIAGEFAGFAIVEGIYMAYFTLEFLVRLITCPCKTDFLKKLMNWIDLLAIVPYFVTIALNTYGVTEEEVVQEELQAVEADELSRTAQYFRLLKMARIVKTLRIIRIFKLARHSTGLQALGNTMKANYKELGLLFLLLFMGAIMFASLIFVFEKEDEETNFKNMFDAYWWAIITMTTVGYGDVSPVTGFGKVLGCFCAIFGVLVIGLPIPIIGNSFTKFYTRQKRWEERETMSAQRKSRQNLSSHHKISVDEKDILSVRGL